MGVVPQSVGVAVQVTGAPTSCGAATLGSRETEQDGTLRSSNVSTRIRTGRVRRRDLRRAATGEPALGLRNKVLNHMKVLLSDHGLLHNGRTTHPARRPSAGAVPGR